MYAKYIKRLFDLLFSLVSVVLLCPILLFVGALIYMEDKGSPFYNASRLGQNGAVFKMYKFRSMKMNAEDIRNEDGSTYNAEDDSRLTKIGKIIRKYSIDEVPQIFNVINGTMSLIGPRPDLPEHIHMYSELEKKKLVVKPGITGYNQAYFRNSISWRERLKNDVFYVEHISFLLDIKIFFATIKSVIFKENIFVENEE